LGLFITVMVDDNPTLNIYSRKLQHFSPTLHFTKKISQITDKDTICIKLSESIRNSNAGDITMFYFCAHEGRKKAKV